MRAGRDDGHTVRRMGAVMSDEDKYDYGTPEHAVRDGLNESMMSYEGYVNSSTFDVAGEVVKILRERNFIVTREPRCECGWIGEGNHYHDRRLDKKTPSQEDLS